MDDPKKSKKEKKEKAEKSEKKSKKSSKENEDGDVDAAVDKKSKKEKKEKAEKKEKKEKSEKKKTDPTLNDGDKEKAEKKEKKEKKEKSEKKSKKEKKEKDDDGGAVTDDALVSGAQDTPESKSSKKDKKEKDAIEDVIGTALEKEAPQTADDANDDSKEKKEKKDKKSSKKKGLPDDIFDDGEDLPEDTDKKDKKNKKSKDKKEKKEKKDKAKDGEDKKKSTWDKIRGSITGAFAFTPNKGEEGNEKDKKEGDGDTSAAADQLDGASGDKEGETKETEKSGFFSKMPTLPSWTKITPRTPAQVKEEELAKSTKETADSKAAEGEDNSEDENDVDSNDDDKKDDKDSPVKSSLSPSKILSGLLGGLSMSPKKNRHKNDEESPVALVDEGQQTDRDVYDGKYEGKTLIARKPRNFFKDSVDAASNIWDGITNTVSMSNDKYPRYKEILKQKKQLDKAIRKKRLEEEELLRQQEDLNAKLKERHNNIRFDPHSLIHLQNRQMMSVPRKKKEDVPFYNKPFDQFGVNDPKVDIIRAVPRNEPFERVATSTTPISRYQPNMVTAKTRAPPSINNISTMSNTTINTPIMRGNVDAVDSPRQPFIVGNSNSKGTRAPTVSSSQNGSRPETPNSVFTNPSIASIHSTNASNRSIDLQPFGVDMSNVRVSPVGNNETYEGGRRINTTTVIKESDQKDDKAASTPSTGFRPISSLFGGFMSLGKKNEEKEKPPPATTPTPTYTSTTSVTSSERQKSQGVEETKDVQPMVEETPAPKVVRSNAPTAAEFFIVQLRGRRMKMSFQNDFLTLSFHDDETESDSVSKVPLKDIIGADVNKASASIRLRLWKHKGRESTEIAMVLKCIDPAPSVVMSALATKHGSPKK